MPALVDEHAGADSVLPTGSLLTRENQHTGAALGLATPWLLQLLLNG